MAINVFQRRGVDLTVATCATGPLFLLLLFGAFAKLLALLDEHLLRSFDLFLQLRVLLLELFHILVSMLDV